MPSTINLTVNQSVKNLTAPELHNLRELVRNLFTIMESDTEGAYVDIYDLALTSAEILGIEDEVS